jgi:hypothetical protein
MNASVTIAGHAARFDESGQLLPWTSWTAALDREMNFYRQCPLDHGYPRFACETFLDAGWTPSTQRSDIIPSTQNGMGIISYLKFGGLRAEQQSVWLATARLMGDYLLHRQARAISAAGRLRLAIRSTVRNSTGQRRDRGLRSDVAVRGQRRTEISGASFAECAGARR